MASRAVSCRRSAPLRHVRKPRAPFSQQRHGKTCDADKATKHARSAKQPRTDVHHGEQANANVASLETPRKPHAPFPYFCDYFSATGKHPIACNGLCTWHVQVASLIEIAWSISAAYVNRLRGQKRSFISFNLWLLLLRILPRAIGYVTRRAVSLG